MKTNRKKMLLSSIAMLLVALVALGSATYAWFSQNKTVTSDNMDVTASAAKGLQITNDRGAHWGNTANFNAYDDSVFTPVSVDYSKTEGGNEAYDSFPANGFYVVDNNVTGKSSETGFGGTWHDDAALPWVATTASSGDNSGKAFNKTDYFAAYEIGVKSSGEAITNATMKVSIVDGSAYARVAIVDHGEGVTPSNNTAFSTKDIVKVYGDEATSPEAVSAVSSNTPTTAPQKVEAFTDGATYSNTAVATLTATGNDSSATAKGHYYTVLVWFEGEDAQCVDTNQSKSVQVAVQFSYT